LSKQSWATNLIEGILSPKSSPPVLSPSSPFKPAPQNPSKNYHPDTHPTGAKIRVLGDSRQKIQRKIGGGRNEHKPPIPSYLSVGKIGESLDFQLEPNRSVSQANRHVAGGTHLTGLSSNRFWA